MRRKEEEKEKEEKINCEPFMLHANPKKPHFCQEKLVA
jgi:hypothetical protein